jgi:hypothetical protein
LGGGYAVTNTGEAELIKGGFHFLNMLMVMEFDQLSDYQLLKKDFALWSFVVKNYQHNQINLKAIYLCLVCNTVGKEADTPQNIFSLWLHHILS